jgi:hypothetical protein
VHDGVDVVTFEDLQNLLPVPDPADDEGGIEHRLAEASRQVVQDDHLLASGTKLEDDVTADVAGASGD